MAEIVCALASSHGPLLTLDPLKWDLRAEADRRRRDHDYRGGVYTFDQLLEMRRCDYLIDQNRPEIRRSAFDRCQSALDVLSAKLRAANPDAVVIVGDDQHEWFREEIQPAFTVFHGQEILNRRFDPERYRNAPPGIADAAPGHLPPQDQLYPVESGLAEHIIRQAIDDEIDVAASRVIPADAAGPIGITHAIGFIVRRIMNDKPIPMVPVLINTFWPPNRAKPGRCYDFGRSIGRAIRTWDSPGGRGRIAVIASGGLSHYLIDEEWDQKILKAFRDRDVATIRSEPDAMFRSGTSETKNWITALGALADTDLEMNLVDYVPCYRTEAGTGNAMGFASWE